MVRAINSLPPLHPTNDAEWILLARKRLGLSQGKLAETIQYSPVTISKIENGHVPLSKKLKKEVEKLLKQLQDQEES